MAMRKEDRQKVYNIVRDHLLEQGERAFDPMQQACLYRYKKVVDEEPGAVKLLKCAAGCLIADEAYSPALEMTTVTQEGPKGDMLRAAIGYSLQTYHSIYIDAARGSMDMLFLRDLQLIHDTGSKANWPVLLKQFADREKLIP